MYRRALLTLLAVSFLMASPARAARSAAGSPGDKYGLGAGFVIGDPTGLTGKYWIDKKGAIDFGIAWSFGDYVLFYGDYLYHFVGAFKRPEKFFKELTPYVGGGLVLLIATASPSATRRYFGLRTQSVGVGIRVPVGLEWNPADVPIGVFLELAPGIGLAPATFVLVEGGIGVRYYF